jgi:hypothetical protein
MGLQHVEDAPATNEIPELAFAVESPDSFTGLGAITAVVLTVQRCGHPVDVKAFIYFDDKVLAAHPGLVQPGTRVAIGVFPAVRGPIRLYEGSLTGLFELDRYRKVLENELFLIGRGAREFPTTGKVPGFEYRIAVQREGVAEPIRLTVASATVPRWPSRPPYAGSFEPVGYAATFKADWLSFRSNNTCYVQVPALLGVRTFEASGAAQGALRRGTQTARTGPSATRGRTRIEAGPGLDLSSARPPADDFRDAAWRCSTRFDSGPGKASESRQSSRTAKRSSRSLIRTPSTRRRTRCSYSACSSAHCRPS